MESPDVVDLKQTTVLITGGTQGIGLGLAQRFLAAGSSVVITGRNAERIEELTRSSPGLRGLVSDIGSSEDRESLATRIEAEFPSLNVVINNAGIQRRIALAADSAPWPERQKEIDILLSGPIHLNSLLVPVMLKQARPGVIINVTSGGAFIPQVFAPIYSACKAAMHSYSVTLRHALQGTPLRVVELIPPAIRTALAGPGASHGAPLDEFCDTVFTELFGDSETVGFGPTSSAEFNQLIDAPKKLFAASAARFPTQTYGNLCGDQR
ncbi:MAG TPA: SDR family NAD(P)-dependent oxidoreductase [Verrucomicrobiae bacterium]|nr:SDR family NAD(P)-dependent oxidoreductase [Verrucomicrobiae bacterium]